MGNNLGDQILKAVDEILDSGNLEKLNSVVSDTVYAALDEVKKQLEKTTAETKKHSAAGANSTIGQKAASQTVRAADNRGVSAGGSRGYRPAPRARVKRVGNVAGVLFQVFGGIGTGVFGILCAAFLVTAIVGRPGFGALSGLMAVFAAASGVMISIGAGKRSRLKRAERYMELMQGKAYNNLYELALLANKSERYVRKDVRQMIQVGIFPEGHLDSRETCLIIGDLAYREYLRLEKLRKNTLLEQPEQKSLEDKGQEETTSNAVEREELSAIVQEGNAYIKQLRELNDLIEGEAVSAKLFRLENILKEIFEQLKEHPEQQPEMHKFMEYYLPTTLKLVTAYEEFDKVSVPGEDILASKGEIEKTLDTINMAFEELLNKLFRDRVYDVTTDAQVLKTMLAREGLTRESVFAERKEEK